MKSMLKKFILTNVALTVFFASACDKTDSIPKDSETSLPATESDELQTYDAGWREGYMAAVEEYQAKNIKLSGEFTVSVHDIIPFYGNSPDGKLLVVSFYQDYPFLLNVDNSLLDEIEVSQTYVFSVEDCILHNVPADYFNEDNISPDILSKPHVIATGCRVAEEHELGMGSICDLTYELYEEE